jgi:hypothetical protein
MSSVLGGGAAQRAAQEQLNLQKAEMDKMRQQAEQEKRDLSEELASKRMARNRGGSRLLLAEERLNPEAGVDETLGAA